MLGSAEIVRADQSPLSLQPRVRRLLIVLATRANDVVSPDWLVDAVWGDGVPQAADAALQTLVSRLRSALRGQAEDIEVQTEVGGYRLRLGREALDAQRFADLLTRAGRAADHEARARLLDQALALWRGPAYAEFAGEPFAEAEAARLNELRVVAQEDRGRAASRARPPGERHARTDRTHPRPPVPRTTPRPADARAAPRRTDGGSPGHVSPLPAAAW